MTPPETGASSIANPASFAAAATARAVSTSIVEQVDQQRARLRLGDDAVRPEIDARTCGPAGSNRDHDVAGGGSFHRARRFMPALVASAAPAAATMS